MTREEAINDLKDFIDTYITVHGEEDIIEVSLDNVDVEAFHMAIKALERDTPMKVNIEKWIYTQCPSGCGYELSTHHGDGYYSIDKKPTFCPKCGQRLDWGCDND